LVVDWGRGGRGCFGLGGRECVSSGRGLSDILISVWSPYLDVCDDAYVLMWRVLTHSTGSPLLLLYRYGKINGVSTASVY